MTLLRHLLLFCLALSAGSYPLRGQAQGFDPLKDVGLAFRKGAVEVTAPAGSHLKAQFMKVEKKSGPGALTVGPLPKTTGADELGDPIWTGTVRIPVKGSGLKDPMLLAITYQPCTEGEGGVCFPPTTRDLKVLAREIPVLREEKKAAAPAAVVASAPKAEVTAAPVPQPEKTAGSRWALILSLLGLYGWGVLGSLTPCVFPMIPIILALIGAKGGGWRRGLALSATLVAGMSLTFTTLIMVSVVAGAKAVAFIQRPVFLFPAALVLSAFALSMFGLFEIALPSSLVNRLQGDGSKKGFRGAFFLGLILGPISAPCIGPALGAVMFAASLSGDLVVGGLQSLAFSLGMGTLFILVGTFGASLPRSGDWLTRIKYIGGAVILGFATWLIRLFLPLPVIYGMGFIQGLILAIALGVFDPAQGLLGGLRKGFAILFLSLGVLSGIRSFEKLTGLAVLPHGTESTANPASPKPTGGDLANWMQNDYEGALARAKTESKFVVIDIFAEWCAQCHELDEKTWPDPSVKQWLQSKAVALRLDTDAKRPDLANPLKVLGYPTIILLDSEGRELRRLQGFHNPQALLAFLEGNEIKP